MYVPICKWLIKWTNCGFKYLFSPYPKYFIFVVKPSMPRPKVDTDTRYDRYSVGIIVGGCCFDLRLQLFVERCE